MLALPTRGGRVVVVGVACYGPQHLRRRGRRAAAAEGPRDRRRRRQARRPVRAQAREPRARGRGARWARARRAPPVSCGGRGQAATKHQGVRRERRRRRRRSARADAAAAGADGADAAESKPRRLPAGEWSTRRPRSAQRPAGAGPARRKRPARSRRERGRCPSAQRKRRRRAAQARRARGSAAAARARAGPRDRGARADRAPSTTSPSALSACRSSPTTSAARGGRSGRAAASRAGARRCVASRARRPPWFDATYRRLAERGARARARPQVGRRRSRRGRAAPRAFGQASGSARCAGSVRAPTRVRALRFCCRFIAVRVPTARRLAHGRPAAEPARRGGAVGRPADAAAAGTPRGRSPTRAVLGRAATLLFMLRRVEQRRRLRRRRRGRRGRARAQRGRRGSFGRAPTGGRRGARAPSYSRCTTRSQARRPRRDAALERSAADKVSADDDAASRSIVPGVHAVRRACSRSSRSTRRACSRRSPRATSHELMVAERAAAAAQAPSARAGRPSTASACSPRMTPRHGKARDPPPPAHGPYGAQLRRRFGASAPACIHRRSRCRGRVKWRRDAAGPNAARASRRRTARPRAVGAAPAR